ncbi:MAG: hypothetical protein ACK4UT_00865 [Moraxellaceae bacterium]
MTDEQWLHVSCLPVERAADGRELHAVQACRAGEVVATARFWVPAGSAVPARATARTAVLAFLPLAMKLGLGLRAESIDALSLAGLREWSEVMAAWHQPLLKPVRIEALHASRVPALRAVEKPRALMAFSGGVDSCHTLWRHSARRGVSALQVAAGLLVQGMDIPLDDSEAFVHAERRSRDVLLAHGAEVLTVATDLRELERRFELDWELLTHGIVLAACLSLFEHAFDVVLVASTYPAHDLQFPWGSNPVTDGLLGGSVPFLHDGVASNKLRKVSDIAADPVITAQLRVCWQGERKGDNCGQCFKCLTTQASLWLAGVARPAAFDRPACVSDLRRLPIKNAVNHRLVADIRAAAVAAGRSDVAQALAAPLRWSKWRRRQLRSMLLRLLTAGLVRR